MKEDEITNIDKISYYKILSAVLKNLGVTDVNTFVIDTQIILNYFPKMTEEILLDLVETIGIEIIDILKGKAYTEKEKKIK
jgi:hypothetical protein